MIDAKENTFDFDSFFSCVIKVSLKAQGKIFFLLFYLSVLLIALVSFYRRQRISTGLGVEAAHGDVCYILPTITLVKFFSKVLLQELVHLYYRSAIS